eukprot:scaffold16654_cov129-Skeletonema_marinoi.AAC.1
MNLNKLSYWNYFGDTRKCSKEAIPLPKISDTLQRMEKFQWASAIDLNMGYYHLTLDMKTREICSLIFPWGGTVTRGCRWAPLRPQ